MIQTAEDIRLLNEKISYSSAFITRINDELSKVIVGQQYMVERLLIGLLRCLQSRVNGLNNPLLMVLK